MAAETDYVYWFNQGGAVVLVVLLITMIYRMANWLASQWLLPMRDAIIAHLKMLDVALEELVESMRAQQAIVEEIRRKLTNDKG